ncbi:MAG: hypothetical protein QGG71_21750 [Pirellulaceae bacterium]|jgi:hypothetical protein|nr:hypothetical protein [Planctomycetaceae bacterium]MDP6557307.1 hypothetical protein [Pirellulaceae bacterium]
MIPRPLLDEVDAVVPTGVTHIGFVATDLRGNFLVTEPRNHPYGTSATLSKIKVQPGDRPSTTLTRCLKEHIGTAVESVYPIPMTWVTPNSIGFYFAGMLEGESSNPHHALHWLPYERAEERIKSSQNAVSRSRDLAILAAASKMCLCPYRRVLLMVKELHAMGFERMRTVPYRHPLAWRCPVVPKAWTYADHGGLMGEFSDSFARSLGLGELRLTYSSGESQQPFQWDSSAFLTPQDLAQRFVRDKPELVAAGWGPDPVYVQWYEEALRLTEPYGVWYAFGEGLNETDHLYVERCSASRVPLPPPGNLDRGHAGTFLDKQEEKPTDDD